jgi:hypothetical protein
MARTARKLTKTDFVRSMGDAKASDIVAAAKKKGMKLSERYVYVIRSNDNARGRGGAVGSGRGARGSRGGGNAEAALRQAIADIGLVAARRIFDEVERAFR